MEEKQKLPQLIFKKVKNSKAIKNFDLEKRLVSYSYEIKQHRKIEKLNGKEGEVSEEMVRAYLLDKLSDELGYDLEKIEIEKEYPAGRPKVQKNRIDVVVKDKDGNPFLFIELKSPEEYEKNKESVIEDQLFSLSGIEQAKHGTKIKYLVLYSIEMVAGKIKDKCLLIDYGKYSSFSEWEKTRDFIDQLPARYEKAVKEPYIKGGKKDLEKNFDHAKLETKRKNLHNVLWGGGGTDDNDVFSSLVNIILAKIQDESEKEDGKKYDFQIFAYAKKDDEAFETNDELFVRINNLYKRALKQRLNITNEQELVESFVVDRKKFSLAKLKYTVSELEGFSFVDGKNSLSGKDILGDFFEGIIREGFKQTKGQFFTHINVVKLLLWGLQLDKLAIETINQRNQLPYMIDPSAGSGTFLIEYMKFITENIKRRFKSEIRSTRDIKERFHNWFEPDHRENKWAETFIYAIEHNFNLGTATKVNMILHGDGSSNIFVKDGLLPFNNYDKTTSPNALNQSNNDQFYKGKKLDAKEGEKETLSVSVNNQFDCILTNPPFSVDLDNDTKKLTAKSFIFGDKKNSENLFIERYYQLLKEGGRMGVVLPESVFDTTENKYIRLFIYKYFKVKAVVSLPQITFEPFTSTKTSLLFAQKKTAAEIEQWQNLWSKYSNEWSLLKTRCEKEIEHFIKEKPINKQWAIASEDEAKRKSNLYKLLKDCIEKDDKKLLLKELVEKYQDEITDLCKYDNDTTDSFGFVNVWWVFGEVAKELNYKILMAEVENVGYKRTKRGEKPMPNELYRASVEDGKEKILIDDGILETALDHLRQINWS
jgi:type I restriction enzyme M protein